VGEEVAGRPGGGVAPLWPARIGLVLAIGGAGYLASVSLQAGGVAGCGPGSGCDLVLSSRWAYWLGIPVSLPAAALYSILLATTWRLRPGRDPKNRFRPLAIALCTVVVAAALWFIFLQDAVIQSWCRFCLATHASAFFSACWLLAPLLGSRRSPAGGETVPPTGGALKVGLVFGLVGTTVLIGGQFVVLERAGYVLVPLSLGGRAPKGQLTLDSGRFGLDPDALPGMGPASAQGFVVGLFDYTCTHCRRLHPLLKEAQAHFAGRLTFIMLPVPLETGCNPMIPLTDPANRGACEYARLALAVWRGRPDAFRGFDDWLFDSAGLPTLPEARMKAETLLGKTALEKVLSDPWVGRQIDEDVRLYIATSQATNSLRLPQLIFADAAVSGSVDDAAELERVIGERAPLIRNAGR